MKLNVGSRSYRFEVVPGPLRDAQGRACASLCDHAKRRILVSAWVPLQVRTEVAALAVSEAWKYQATHGDDAAIPFVGVVN